MMRRKIIGMVVVILILSGQTAFAKDKATLATLEYLFLCDANGDGVYMELIRSAYEAVDVELALVVLPIRRGISNFIENKYDMFFSYSLLNEDEIEKAAWKETMGVIVGFFYTNRKFDDFHLNTLDDFKGYKMGTIMNSSLLSLLQKHELDVYQVRSLDQQLHMLKAGRFDFMNAAVSSALLQIKSLFPDNTGDFAFIEFKNLFLGPCFLKGNAKSMVLKDKFETGLDIIKKNGKYMEIMESYWGKGNVPKGTLPEDIKKYGVDKPNLTLFHSYNRKAYGKIIEE